ncbi:hypothetical protein ABZ317_23090, partial [Streptomyces microflavus]
GGPVTVFGELGHRGFDPFAAWDTGAGRGGGAGPEPVRGSVSQSTTRRWSRCHSCQWSASSSQRLVQ